MDKEFRLKDGLHVSGNAAVVGSITTVDSVQFNLSHNVTNEVGMLDWSIDDNTIELGLSPNVTLQIGQEQLYLVKNQTGNTINNGTVVMAAGTLGASGRILVTPAISDGTFPSQYIMGLATETIVDGGDGFVSSFGKVRGLNTSMFSNGDILYADPAVPGGLSNVAPIAPNNKVTVALVVNSDINNGVLFVRPTFGSSIEDDENVYLSNLADGQVLAWSSANARFENLTLTSNGGGGATNLSYSANSSTVTISSDTGTDAVIAGATNTTAGVITAGVQTFGGEKTFDSLVSQNGLTVDTDTLFVDSVNNRIGAGTISPAARLHIVGGGLRVQSRSDPVNNNYAGYFLNATDTTDIGTTIAHYQGDDNFNDAAIRLGGIGANEGTINVLTNGSVIVKVNPAGIEVTGNTIISGGIVANSSLGTNGQVLTSNGSGIYWDTLSGVSLDYVNLKANASSPTLSNTVTFTNAITENVHTLSGTTNVQLNAANGTIQVHTLTAATSYTDGLSSGQYITLMIDDGAARLVTWPTITWVNNRGLAPTLATTGYTVISIWKVSSTLYGALVGDGT